MGMVDYFRLPKRSGIGIATNICTSRRRRGRQRRSRRAEIDGGQRPRLNSVDGTDDAQLIVTVVDAGRQSDQQLSAGDADDCVRPGRISDRPEHHVRVQFGHRDSRRQAAMEFRSYYAGKTVIRATSPGLKDATIEIISLGEPKFIAGKTPAVKPRPYVRFTGSPANSWSRFGHGKSRPAPAAKRPATADAWPTMGIPPRSGRPPPATRTRGGRWTWNAL
jgi:beta-galactosidase